ncbi:hypothetical protein [Streptomyces sp. x-19]|uniref:hypothetical protein n=1 Tax=Streptomyces sp. x-19 TaxID=2789280 RepID=UPI00397F0D88
MAEAGRLRAQPGDQVAADGGGQLGPVRPADRHGGALVTEADVAVGVDEVVSELPSEDG